MREIACAALAALALAGCGGDGDEELVVSAAASLTEAFEAYGAEREGEERFSFGGSDELAAQIRQGARPDVYAAADTTHPSELHREGLVSTPVSFASNRLVLAVPDGGEIDSIGDITRPGVDLLIGAEGVPAGDYARELLARLPAAERRAILANVRSREPDVKGIVGKLAQGAADAGFVYATDAAAAPGLREVGLPRAIAPDVAYGVAVVEGGENPEGAEAFIDGLLEGPGAQALGDAGFGPPPAR